MKGRPTLDIEDHQALRRYLVDRGAAPSAQEIDVKTLPGGVSCSTVRVRFPSGEAWVLKQALSRLRVTVEWFADPARTHREALAMDVLGELCPSGSIPRLVFEDQENNLLAMEAVPDPHENWKSMLLAGRLEDDHVRQFADLLAAIHAESFRRRETLDGMFADRSFFRALRLEPYYAYSGQQVPETAAFIAELIRQTEAHVITLVHGDYSPKNVLVREGRLVLLDHEVIHLGDPAFDLGFSLTHLMSKAHHLPEHRDRFAGAARLYWARYRRGVEGMPWAEALEARAARSTLGCLLARAAGRSPLEYLSGEERRRQVHAVTALTAAPPDTVDDLLAGFLELVGAPAGGA